MNICIIDYGMGNIASVRNAIESLGYSPELVSTPKDVDSFEVILLPGVGAFGKAMEVLRSNGMDQAIIAASESGKKVIGICLGMQLLFDESHEFGRHKGLGLIKGKVLPFDEKIDLTIPHMGWNNTETQHADYKTLEGDFYFVHSFYCSPDNAEDVLYMTDYGIKFCSGVARNGQIIGLQFHPEKSQSLGLSLLKKVLADA